MDTDFGNFQNNDYICDEFYGCRTINLKRG